MSLAADIDIQDIDLSDLSLFADGPPHNLFERMRAEAPVHRNPAKDGGGFWSLTRYQDILPVNRDWQTFSSARHSITVEDGVMMPREFESRSFLMMDPPEHDKQRSIVQSVFSPRAVMAREGRIREIVGELIDGVSERGECDLALDIAAELPLIVISEMLGVPAEDRQQLFYWTNLIAAPDDGELRRDETMFQQAIGELLQYVMALVVDRRAHPRDDLMSRLAQAEVDGERLSDFELATNFVVLMGGGNETTRNTFLGGSMLLIEHPDQRRALIEDPSLIPNAIEEILRYHTPFIEMARTATRDVELHGTEIKAGDKVVLWYASANRDETANPRPHVFDVQRPDIKQISFGPGGKHTCLGHQLARLELRILFSEVLRRMPDMELAGPCPRIRSNFVNGFKAMPVTFTPTL